MTAVEVYEALAPFLRCGFSPPCSKLGDGSCFVEHRPDLEDEVRCGLRVAGALRARLGLSTEQEGPDDAPPD